MDKKSAIIQGKLGPIKVYNDIPVMPAQGLLAPMHSVWFKGGPIWHDWDENLK